MTMRNVTETDNPKRRDLERAVRDLDDLRRIAEQSIQPGPGREQAVNAIKTAASRVLTGLAESYDEGEARHA
jgi:hypothetical protein